jgi:hypothetical protein
MVTVIISVRMLNCIGVRRRCSAAARGGLAGAGGGNGVLELDIGD